MLFEEGVRKVPQIIEGTLREIFEKHPELSDKRVRLYVLDGSEPAQNLLEFLGDWVGSVNIPDSVQATDVEQVIVYGLDAGTIQTSTPF